MDEQPLPLVPEMVRNAIRFGHTPSGAVTIDIYAPTLIENGMPVYEVRSSISLGPDDAAAILEDWTMAVRRAREARANQP